jgi:hypothetical protein
MAFCATAPGDRFNFFATAVPDNFAFASSLSVRTSSFDHATIRRLDFDFAFAMNVLRKKADMIARDGEWKSMLYCSCFCETSQSHPDNTSAGGLLGRFAKVTTIRAA